MEKGKKIAIQEIMKYDINKIQKQFDLFKIKNKSKTLKDFCNLKKLDYLYIYRRMKSKDKISCYTIKDYINGLPITELLKIQNNKISL